MKEKIIDICNLEKIVKKILIVENEQLVAMNLQIHLERAGYQVLGICPTHESAVALINNNKPDFIFMDINLDSETNGIQSARFIKETFNIPSIFLTSLKDIEVIEQAKEVEPLGYLVKPFKQEDIYTALNIALTNYDKSKSLEKDYERISQAVQKIDSALVFFDTEFYSNWYNHAFEKLIGQTYKPTTPINLADKFLVHGENLKSFIERFSYKELLQDSVFFDKAEVFHKTKPSSHVKGQIIAFHNLENQIEGYFALLQAYGKNEKEKIQVIDEVNVKVVGTFMYVRDKGAYHRVHLGEVSFIEALGNYVKLTTEKNSYVVLVTLKDMENILPSSMFIRVHRSFIVNVSQIDWITSSEIRIGNNTIPLGKTYKEDIFEYLGLSFSSN